MPARIRIMPRELALKIAAGEVVGRPASAVKELLDNAIDAGASQIKVEIREAGLKLIRVTDDGCGISRQDLPLAFTSHATSKINSLDDLERLSTLGFRGEALSSIAAVSRVEVQTRSEEESGSRLIVEFGNELALGVAASPRGTRIAVSDLFANVPARRKFVRSQRAEAAQIQHVVALYALAQPQIRFSLTIDDHLTFHSPGNGQVIDVLAAVHGAAVAESMLPMAAAEGNIAISGMISAPELSRPNRSSIAVFVNGRPVQNRSLGFALEEAYSGFLMTGRHPVAAIHLSLPPEEVDANIHPSKSEVRFARDREVHGALNRAVASTLLEMRVQARDLESDFVPLGAMPSGETALPLPEMPTPSLLPEMPALRVFGQTNQAFIVAEGPQGLYMIDQHAAHERILFDRLDQQFSDHAVQVHSLLEPVSVDLTPEELAALDTNSDLLAHAGFVLEAFGTGACLIRSVPALAGRGNPVDLVREVLTELCHLTEPDAARERALAAMACKAAVKAGQLLEVQEMREIVLQLERTARPATCPHGRPTMIHLSHSQLEREFGRR